MTLLLVFLGGALGAVLRYLSDLYIQAGLFRKPAQKQFPVGTLVINVVGSFVLGVVTARVTHHQWSPQVMAFAGTGLCGGFTTFSTFSVEGANLLQRRRLPAATSYLGLSVALGVGAAALGWII